MHVRFYVQRWQFQVRKSDGMTVKQTSYDRVLIKLHSNDNSSGYYACCAYYAYYALHMTLFRFAEIAKAPFGTKSVKQRSVKRACDRSLAATSHPTINGNV